MSLQITDPLLWGDRLIYAGNENAQGDFCLFRKENLGLLNLNLSERNLRANDKSLRCFKSLLIKRLGPERFGKVCETSGISFNRLEETRSSLTTKEVHRIFFFASQVTRKDMEAAIKAVKEGADWVQDIPEAIRGELAASVGPEDLSAETFHTLYAYLEDPFKGQVSYQPREHTFFSDLIERVQSIFGKFIYDPLYNCAQRWNLNKTNHALNTTRAFYERMAMSIVKCEEMDVGTYIRGPNTPEGNPQYYRLSGKLYTAGGQFGMIMTPAHPSMASLDTLWVTRGTPFSAAGIDAISYWITDSEEEIGKEGFTSAEPYRSVIDEKFGSMVEIGYSIGGAMAQWRASERLPKELWTFRSPGVPESVNEKFFQTLQQSGRGHFDIHIMRTVGDCMDKGGKTHIGKIRELPPNLNILYSEFYIDGYRHMDLAIGGNSRNNVGWGGGYQDEEIYHLLDNVNRSSLENIRWFFGSHIVCPLLRVFRKLIRALVPARAQLQRGLWIEDIRDGGSHTLRYIHQLGTNNLSRIQVD